SNKISQNGTADRQARILHGGRDRRPAENQPGGHLSLRQIALAPFLPPRAVGPVQGQRYSGFCEETSNLPQPDQLTHCCVSGSRRKQSFVSGWHFRSNAV